MSQAMGSGAARTTTVDYFRNTLCLGDEEGSPFSEARKILDSLNAVGIQFGVNAQMGTESVVGYSLSGVLHGEIQRRYSTLRK